MSSHHAVHKLTTEQSMAPASHLFHKLPLVGTVVGLAALLIAFYLGKSDVETFFFSFHVSYLFFLSLAFGAIFFVLIQFATKAGWSVVVRRLAENVAMTIPLFAVLFVVTILGSHHIFHHWLSHESYSDAILATKRWYLNLPFLYSRAAFYFVAFTWAAYYFGIKSAKQDATGSHGLTRQMQNASYPFSIVLGFCVTFAAFDWIMSLDPHWYSTIFGIYFFASCFVAFLALLVVLTRLMHSIPTLKNIITVEHYHDLGKLVFGHSCFWAYAAFAQYLLIWYGNIPEETKWYAVRQSGGWTPFWYLLCLGHFLVPFLFLMARRAKRSHTMVVLVSLWILVMHFVDLYWLIVPTYSKQGPQLGFIDVFCFVGIGGLFIALFSALARKKPLIPIQDPRLNESLTYENV